MILFSIPGFPIGHELLIFGSNHSLGVVSKAVDELIGFRVEARGVRMEV